MNRDEVMALEGCALDEALARALGIKPLQRLYIVTCGTMTIGPTLSRQQAEEVLREEQRRWPEREYKVKALEVYPEYDSWEGVPLVEEAMAQRGHYLTLRSPFEPGQPYFAGFTPHGTTGWDGRPDHEAPGATAPLAVARAALLALLSEETANA
jgi:hypothetical protein